MDLFDKFRKDKGPLGKYSDVAEGYYVFPKIEGQISNRMRFNGKEVVIWSINNYLGLANHPEIKKVDGESAAKWGMAYPMGARMMSGNTDKHVELEDKLADFVNKEAGLLVNFGYQGMLSAIDALLSRRDVVVYDSDCHACIVDGVRLHMGKRFAYDHNDIESLEKNLKRAEKLIEGTSGGIMVISEGVFGMRGEQGKLKEIIALKEKHEFKFFVDDAHGFGTLGKTGAGAGEEQGVQDGIDIYFATFAKSMAGVGAFFAGEKDMIDFLKYNMRSQMFAKSLMMPMVEGALKRLDMLKTMPELKNKLWEITNALQSGLKERGYNIGKTNTCVTPVFMEGSVEEAMNLVYDLRENHSIFCSIVVYPVIPKGMILLRLIPTSVHTLEDVKLTLDAFDAVSGKLRSGAYASMATSM